MSNQICSAPLPVDNESDADSVADEIPHTKPKSDEVTDTKMKDDEEDEDDDEGDEDEEL